MNWMLMFCLQDHYVMGAFDGKALFNVTVPPKIYYPGFAALGTDSFALADFDNLRLAGQEEGAEVMVAYSRSRSLQFASEDSLLWYMAVLVLFYFL